MGSQICIYIYYLKELNQMGKKVNPKITPEELKQKKIEKK